MLDPVLQVHVTLVVLVYGGTLCRRASASGWHRSVRFAARALCSDLPHSTFYSTCQLDRLQQYLNSFFFSACVSYIRRVFARVIATLAAVYIVMAHRRSSPISLTWRLLCSATDVVLVSERGGATGVVQNAHTPRPGGEAAPDTRLRRTFRARTRYEASSSGGSHSQQPKHPHGRHLWQHGERTKHQKQEDRAGAVHPAREGRSPWRVRRTTDWGRRWGRRDGKRCHVDIVPRPNERPAGFVLFAHAPATSASAWAWPRRGDRSPSATPPYGHVPASIRTGEPLSRHAQQYPCRSQQRPHGRSCGNRPPSSQLLPPARPSPSHRCWQGRRRRRGRRRSTRCQRWFSRPYRRERCRSEFELP